MEQPNNQKNEENPANAIENPLETIPSNNNIDNNNLNLNLNEIAGNQNNKQKYSTIQEYLDKLLYPSLKIAINDLINEIKNNDYYKDLEKEFNSCFFRNKAEILQKQKQLLKLERGDDYSEGDYEYWLRQNVELNESKTERDLDNEEEEDPDLDDSDILNLQEEQLEKESEEENQNKFDPIKFLVERLREINLNKGGDNNNNDLELSLEKEVNVDELNLSNQNNNLLNNNEVHDDKEINAVIPQTISSQQEEKKENNK